MPKPKAPGGNKKPPSVPVFNEIFGTGGNDEITPNSTLIGPTTSGDDLVWGGSGDDTIDGGAGNDELHGEDGVDLLVGADGNDTIFGDAGVDLIDGGIGSDTIHGGTEDDILIGGGGDDFIFGDAGNDTIFEGAGSDTIDGGDGIDEVIYYGSVGLYGETGVDYTYRELTEVQGKGKNRQTVVIGVEVFAQDGSGDVDTITNVESVLFLPLPGEGTIVTQGDLVSTRADTGVTIDVLANDTGDSLTVSNILDIQIDLDGDGVNDIDLIPDGADVGYFSDPDGGILNDGSILTLNPDGMLTWDPGSSSYPEPAGGALWPQIAFWYEVTDATGATEYGDVTIQLTYPAPTGDITFETMELFDPALAELLGYYIYKDGPDGVFLVSQLTTATGYFEERDVTVTDGDYDYDGDGDAEFRIWTDGDGTTHEMNVVHGYNELFGLETVTFTGVDAGETVTIEYWSLDGYTKLGEDTVDFSTMTPDGDDYVFFANEMDIGQVSFIAGAGDSVYVDDLVLV